MSIGAVLTLLLVSALMALGQFWAFKIVKKNIPYSWLFLSLLSVNVVVVLLRSLFR
jgi:hypothetical protein